MKRLIVLIDGTWNTYFKRVKSEHNDWSNVHKIRSLIARRDAKGNSQITLYTRGVGTSHFFDQVIGGIIGAGIEEQVLDAYMSLSDNYEEGDEIYLIGFSRGAVAIRSLSDLIARCHLLRGGHLNHIKDIWSYYSAVTSDPNMVAARGFDRIAPHVTKQQPKIKCIAVWDTVAGDNFTASMLKHQAISPNVETGLHAISINESRALFEPLLWTPAGSENAAIRQVLFPGSHSDVGGGYKKRGFRT